MTPLIVIESPVLYFTGDKKILTDPGMTIHAGITAIMGPNGAGKTTFAKILEKGRNFRTNKIISPSGEYPKIKYLEFNDIHSLSGLKIDYYQQRYEATMNEEVPEVGLILGDKTCNPIFRDLCKKFNLQNIENKKINFLSSGELRKLLIINALLDTPDILILDNPYIGLDLASKEILNQALKNLKSNGKSILLLVADPKDVPDFTDHFFFAHSLNISANPSLNTHLSAKTSDTPLTKDVNSVGSTTPVIELINCEVKYENITVLNNINWKVMPGERWRLSGPNGSGKSTLLSLINADNPKGYCNNIYLFGRKRGTGESIWDIKKNIGYVSPEMQLHFHGSGTALQIVANGLNDTVGLYVKPDETQIEKAEKLMEHFGILHLKDRVFSNLSAGERQLVLVARAMIKEPLLLILDEPMHGLDESNILLVQNTIEDFLISHPQSAFIMVSHNPDEIPSLVDKTFHLPLSNNFL